MRRLKKCLSQTVATVLVFVLICTILSSYAMEANASEINLTNLTDETVDKEIVTTANTKEDYYDNIDEAATALRERLKNRESSISISIVNDGSLDEKLATDIWNAAVEHTGVPDEGDYIAFNYYSMNSSVSMSSGAIYQTCTYTVSYLTTATQEETFTERLNEVMDSLDLDSKCDYQKIYAIYDWICSNVTYDYDHQGDVTYTQQYTAYGALIDGASSCQGFAILLYRMLLEAGIDARIIKGTSQDTPHVWNIVKLGNIYYDLDSNWDSVYVREYGATSYGFLLKCEDNFGDHTRDSEYTTDDFNAAYPMTTTDYAYTNDSDHGYSDPVFAWAGDFSSCVATFSCKSGDGDVHTVNCTVTSDYWIDASTGNSMLTYTATCSFQNSEYSDTVDIDQQASSDSDNSDDMENQSDADNPTDSSTLNNGSTVATTFSSAAVKLVRPTSVTCNVQSKSIRVTWKSVSQATGYYIYRKVGDNSYSYVDKTSKNSWTDTSVSNGKKYSYKICAYNDSVKSSFSAVKSTYFLKKASLSKVKNSKGKQLKITWKKNMSASGYQIQYSTSRTFSRGKTKTVRNGKKNNVTLSGLKEGKKYYIRVRSYRKVSGKMYYSAWSNKKSKKVSQ